MTAEATGGDDRPLRSGWTTGACATAATRAALLTLWGDGCPQTVSITLPRGEQPVFAVTMAESGPGWARAGVVKDAGDDPDVTHGAIIIATVRIGASGQGVVFAAGPGVGTVTKPGLPLPVGEPAINPVPRHLMTAQVAELAASWGKSPDVVIEISVPGGEEIACRTWNPRLGILGGISILGTTGVVIPYSCSAWIDAIRRGVDVARATGITHVAGCVGNTSEKAVRSLYGLGEDAIIDMGDFVGGMLKYLRDNPVGRVTIAGGFAKLSKLAAGHMDLHSKRSQVDLHWLSDHLRVLGADQDLANRAEAANTALEVLELAQAAGLPLGDVIAAEACRVARDVVRGTPMAVDVAVFDRKGQVVGLCRS